MVFSYLLGAFVEWVVILMLLLHSIFSYIIFRFALYFRLKKPCFCCSSALFINRHTDLVPTRCSCCEDTRFKQNLITCQSSRYAADSFIHEKGILEGTDNTKMMMMMIQHHQQPSYNYNQTSLVKPPMNAQNKSIQLIRDLYSDENVVEFTFSEDESVEKDIVREGGYKGIGDDEFTWGCAFPESETLANDSTCCSRLDESACAVSTTEISKVERQGALIRHKKVNDDECYSIAYTAEGDLVMDLRRNLAPTKSISTASFSLDAIPQIKATTEQQRDELSHQAHGELLVAQNIENTERIIELDEEDQPPKKSTGIPTPSYLLHRTIDHIHEQIQEVPHSVFMPPPTRTEKLVCEQAEETSTPASVYLPSEHKYEQNGEVVPNALPNSPLPPNVEELSQMQAETYQEQAPASSLPLSVEDHSDFSQIDNRGSNQLDESMALNESNYVEATEHPSTVSLSLMKNEVDKLPDTPSSCDGANYLYRSWLLLEKKESATEETLDGSIISDFVCGEGIMTVDKLKTALRVERKALHALYAELEEERNASAVAACQTMAMINRLQEEKASVQMEALQYQRMMEEQSEYDQEALQLLNELMVKREREKQELEKELEIYRKRVTEYETKERLMMLNRKKESLRSGSSSVSYSNAEDSDGVSIDLKLDMKNMNGFEGKEEENGNNTPLDDVLHLDESLSHFEEERLSILEQLKVLEDNLFTLDDGDDGFSCNHDCSCITNGTENGCRNDAKGNYHQERRTVGPKAKMLLPLFDASVEGHENGELSRNENGHDFTSYPHSLSSISEPENKNICIEEEVDHVYERLQVLEADKEFLRHCFSSLKKGDKGLELLQEILQHLRDLRSVELEIQK